MTPRPTDPALLARIEAYLDGAMSDAERAAFEREAGADPAIREELSLQERIDRGLRHLYTPPSFESLESLPARPAMQSARRMGVPAWFKAAAAVALLGVGAWLAVARPWQGLGVPQPSALSADAALSRLVVDQQFKPVWVCDTDEKFLAYTKQRLGVPFLVRPRPGVELVGWAYDPGVMGGGQALLVRAEGKQIVVLFGSKIADRTLRSDPGSSLHVTRGEPLGLVAYEISPLDHTVVLDAIKEP